MQMGVSFHIHKYKKNVFKALDFERHFQNVFIAIAVKHQT